MQWEGSLVTLEVERGTGQDAGYTPYQGPVDRKAECRAGGQGQSIGVLPIKSLEADP